MINKMVKLVYKDDIVIKHSELHAAPDHVALG